MQIITQTDRLLIREFISADLEEILILNSDPKVLEYTGDALMTREDEAQQLLNSFTEQYKNHGFAPWAVHEKKAGRMLGWCGLGKSHNAIALTVRFKKKFWNKGYGTESCTAVLDYGFNNHSINEIIAKPTAENEAMLAVLKKLNFMQTSQENHKGLEKKVFTLSNIDFKPSTQ